MIPRRANQHLQAAILTLYGVVTLSGPALHALPGFGHRFTGLTSEHRASPGHGDRQNAAAHDCPICHFHAQGQLVADPDDGPCIDVVRIRPADQPLPLCPPAVDQPSIPRAPPLG